MIEKIKIKNKIFNNKYDFLKYCKVIVVFSHIDKNILSSFNLYKKTKFLEIPLPSKFSFKKNEMKFKYDFIISGRLEEIKNIGAILDFIGKNKQFKFVVCGDGKFKDNFCNIKNVEIYSSLNQEELLKKYRESKFLLLFSFVEGFPFVVIEALSQGIPCIIFDNFPSASFLIGSNERGLLINPNNINKWNDINDYIKNIQYKEVSNNCFEFAIKFLSLNNFISKWKNILEKDLYNK